MKKFIYFAKGAGGLGADSYVAEADMIASIVPQTVLKTAVYFNKTDNTKDKIVFTHDNTTNT